MQRRPTQIINAMNATRRKDINNIIDKLDELKSQIEDLMQEEQDALDNLPESLQYSERGERMQEAVDALENASESVQEVIDNLNEATEA